MTPSNSELQNFIKTRRYWRLGILFVFAGLGQMKFLNGLNSLEINKMIFKDKLAKKRQDIQDIDFNGLKKEIKEQSKEKYEKIKEIKDLKTGKSLGEHIEPVEAKVKDKVALIKQSEEFEKFKTKKDLLKQRGQTFLQKHGIKENKPVQSNITNELDLNHKDFKDERSINSQSVEYLHEKEEIIGNRPLMTAY